MAATPSGLRTYRAKRDFSRTAEPAGKGRPPIAGAMFVVQKHAARRLHYDVRLEFDGVLKSWAVPKGPSLDPGKKRLAVLTEDHPLDYAEFEGVIPQGEYGGGTVIVWDRGTYAPVPSDGKEIASEDIDKEMRHAFAKGRIRVRFAGDRLDGTWSLVRMARPDDEGAWLMIKSRDAQVDPARDLTEEAVSSVLTGRTIEDVESQEGTPAEVARRLRSRRTTNGPTRSTPQEDTQA